MQYMEINDLTKFIIGSAYNVYNKLGFGFLESIYEKSLHIEILKAGLRCECQKPIKVFYEEMLVGEYNADLLVEQKIIVELKAVNELSKLHEVQLVNYLNATRINDGLLINFGPNNVQVRHKYRTNRAQK